MVALNSKTYCCWGEGEASDSKYSSKGLSKRTNNFTREHFLSVLNCGRAVSGTNKGFVVRDNEMLTYSQVRTGLTAFYAKRRMLSDGVSTANLEL